MDQVEPLTEGERERRKAVLYPHLMLMLEASKFKLAIMKATLAAVTGEHDVVAMYGRVKEARAKHDDALHMLDKKFREELYSLAGGIMVYDTQDRFLMAMSRKWKEHPDNEDAASHGA